MSLYVDTRKCKKRLMSNILIEEFFYSKFKVKRDRMLNGIHPFLPNKEEREEAKKQYAHLLEDWLKLVDRRSCANLYIFYLELLDNKNCTFQL